MYSMDKLPNNLLSSQVVAGDRFADKQLPLGGDGDGDEVIPWGDRQLEREPDRAEVVRAQKSPGGSVEAKCANIDHIDEAVDHNHSVDASPLFSSNNGCWEQVHDHSGCENYGNKPRMICVLINSHCVLGAKF